MAVKSTCYPDKQRCKEKVKEEGKNINGSFFYRGKKHPEIDKNRVESKENEKVTDI